MEAVEGVDVRFPAVLPVKRSKLVAIVTTREQTRLADQPSLFDVIPMARTPDEVEKAEKQIKDLQRDVDYQVREYPIEVVVQKHLLGQEEGKNELFVPDYQRDLVWDAKRQSKFIESLLIGLPIPYLFAADVGSDDEELAGRLEIVDGTQRIRTLARFVKDELVLRGLEKLHEINGFKYSDLAPSRQRRFKRITLRMIELTEQATEETRRDMFERINTGSVRLNPMETRRGSSPGPFIALIDEISKDRLFDELAPNSEASRKRLEREELTIRFFAFADRLETYGKDDAGKVVSEFVDTYVDDMNAQLAKEGPNGPTEQRMRKAWTQMLGFVAKHFPNGFTKTAKSKSTPRVRFEAIAVGSYLALLTKPDLDPKPEQMSEWLRSPSFRDQTTSDAANNRSRVLGRIEYVRDRLLGK